MNIVVLQGRPTQNPQLLDTKTDTIMCKMRLAVDRTRRGNKRADFFDVITFGEKGRIVYQHLQKGGLCTVLGRVEQSEYRTHFGDKRDTYQVIADTVTIHDWSETATERSERQSRTNGEVDIPLEIIDSLRKQSIDLTDEDIPSWP